MKIRRNFTAFFAEITKSPLHDLTTMQTPFHRFPRRLVTARPGLLALLFAASLGLRGASAQGTAKQKIDRESDLPPFS